jgi:hypothetical protein
MRTFFKYATQIREAERSGAVELALWRSYKAPKLTEVPLELSRLGQLRKLYLVGHALRRVRDLGTGALYPSFYASSSTITGFERCFLGKTPSNHLPLACSDDSTPSPSWI